MKSNVLMVSPKNFDVMYSINPWMNTSVPVNRDKMLSQWDAVKDTLEKNDVNVEVIDSAPGLCDMVFAANAGMVYKDKAIVSSFRDKERQAEEPLFRKWFESKGYSTYQLNRDAIWEGQACSVFIDDILFCGYSEGGRANMKSFDEISEIWEIPKSEMYFANLIDPYFYHLDVSFCLLDEKNAIACPLAFKMKDYEWLKQHIPNIIEVSYDDALNFSCNAYVSGKNIFMSSLISYELKEKLNEIGYNALPLDVTEFIKSGGGVKCLILSL